MARATILLTGDNREQASLTQIKAGSARSPDPAKSALGGDCRLFLHDLQYLGDNLIVDVRILVDVEMADVGMVAEIDIGDRPLEPLGRHHFLPELVRLVVV